VRTSARATTWLEIVLGVLVLLIVLLAVGGVIARNRQLERTRGRFDMNLAQVNEDLAVAHAADRGWARDTLDEAARAAWAQERPGEEPESLMLVQIVDNPGTDEDKAVYEVVAAGGRTQRLTLGRRDGAWIHEALE
jgi:hypothetical protein